MLVFEVLGTLFKLTLLAKQFESFNPLTYLKMVIWPLSYIFILGSILLYGESKLFENNIIGLLAFLIIGGATLAVIIYFAGFDEKEKGLVNSFIINKIKKL